MTASPLPGCESSSPAGMSDCNGNDSTPKAGAVVRSKLAYLLQPVLPQSPQTPSTPPQREQHPLPVPPPGAAAAEEAAAPSKYMGGQQPPGTEVPSMSLPESAGQRQSEVTPQRNNIAVSQTSQESPARELQRLRQFVRELTRQAEEASHATQTWREYAVELQRRLAEHTDDVPEKPDDAQICDMVSSSDAIQKVGQSPAVLGIKSSRCGGCGKEDGACDRVFTELGKVYCNTCWSHWERCGWWKPSMRVLTAPPPVRSPGGLPQYVAEDAFVLPGFMCDHDDFSLFHKLKDELPEGRDFGDWHGGRHLGIQFEGEGARHDGENAPSALKAAVAKLEAAFGIRASASRLNMYNDSTNFKPFHRDRGRDQNGTPQVTVGASFGGTRELTMVHIASGVTCTFPQKNGDVFSFTPELNNTFMHGVPKIGFGSPSIVEGQGPRMSLILWGSKVSLLEG